MICFQWKLILLHYKELLRVPGIGKISARRIIESRKKNIFFKNLEELKNIGVVINRAEIFVKLNKSYQSTLYIKLLIYL